MNLKNQRVLITRPVDQAEQFIQKLNALGAVPIAFPVIEISSSPDTTALDRALSRLHCYDWLVLTSVNGVAAVWARLDALGISNLPKSLRVAAVGPKTAAALGTHQVTPDFVPDEYIGEAILPGLGALQGSLVLMPSADIARDTLANAISNSDGVAHVISAYQTIPASPNPEGLAALQKGVDLVTFTSPSTVRNFVALTEQAGFDPYALPGEPHFACIGPITAAAADELTLPVDIIAKDYTVAGLIQAILAHQLPNEPNIPCNSNE